VQNGNSAAFIIVQKKAGLIKPLNTNISDLILAYYRVVSIQRGGRQHPTQTQNFIF
jgi:hypothetical protein